VDYWAADNILLIKPPSTASSSSLQTPGIIWLAECTATLRLWEVDVNGFNKQNIVPIAALSNPHLSPLFQLEKENIKEDIENN